MVTNRLPDKRDPLTEVFEAVGRDSEMWDREKDRKIAGRIIELGEIDTNYGVSQVVVILTGDNREIRVPAFGQVLKREFGERDLRPGDLFGISYLGLQQGRSGSEYHSYRVVHRDPDGNPIDRRTEGRHEPPPADFTLVDDPDDGEPF
jgi:hypothetical protein